MDVREKEVKKDPLFPFLVGLVGTSGCYVSKTAGVPPPSAICDGATVLQDSIGVASDGESRKRGKEFGEYTEMILQQEAELDALDEACGAFCDGLSEMLELETSSASRIPRRDFTGDPILDDLKERHGSALTALHSGLGEPKKKRRNLSKGATEVLNRWFFLHLHDPYPTDEEKQILSKQTGLSLSQCNNWFGNKRMRYKRKMLDQARRASQHPVPGVVVGEGTERGGAATGGPALPQPITPGADSGRGGAMMWKTR